MDVSGVLCIDNHQFSKEFKRNCIPDIFQLQETYIRNIFKYVTDDRKSCFYGTKLKVRIPASVIYVGKQAFPAEAVIEGLNGLQKIEDGSYMRMEKICRLK